MCKWSLEGELGSIHSQEEQVSTNTFTIHGTNYEIKLLQGFHHGVDTRQWGVGSPNLDRRNFGKIQLYCH